jgi:hypothetical protein
VKQGAKTRLSFVPISLNLTKYLIVFQGTTITAHKHMQHICQSTKLGVWVQITCLKGHSMLGSASGGFRDVHSIVNVFEECKVISEVQSNVWKHLCIFGVCSELWTIL